MSPEQWLLSTNLTALRRAVLRWYSQNARDLPWRNLSDPYPIWVSEVMLQQTQVATVREYFARFLDRFPTVHALARADSADVLHLWQGLGYYRRARHLHRAAQVVVDAHDGRFPEDPVVAAQLPGLGRYTANAIASFAFGRRVPILEANTLRLWTRVCAASGDPKRPPLNEQLWNLAEVVLPAARSADFNQAVMDVGSGVCTPRSPNCPECPLRDFCQASLTNTTELFPQNAPKRSSVAVDHVAVVVWNGDEVLISQRPATGPWADLWEFPRVEREGDESWEAAAMRAVRGATDADFRLAGERTTIRHGIMHYKVRLRCFDAQVAASCGRSLHAAANARWVRVDALQQLPFSSPQRRLIASISASGFQESLF